MQNNMFISVTDDAKRESIWFSHERNQITVLDESIPSPGEIQSQETIVLPEVVSMSDYIRRHYESQFIELHNAMRMRRPIRTALSLYLQGGVLMNNWFSWNGVCCTEKGLWVTELPPLTVSTERAAFSNIPAQRIIAGRTISRAA